MEYSNPIADMLAGVPEGERRALAEAFRGRTLPLLCRIVDSASADKLKESLTAATDVGTLSRLLAEAAAQPAVRALDPLAEASTVQTDYRRLNAAVQHCITRRPAWCGDRRNPLAGVRVQAPERRTVPELGEDEARQLLAELRKDLRRRWRAYATLAIALETGRRVSEIGPATFGCDYDTLRASDFERGEDGRLYVTFRAATLKGRNYGRGNLTIPATRGLEVVYRYLRRFHPNPLGPDAPLIWSPQNPRVPVSYTAARRAFVEAWRATHGGEDPPRGMKFHALCYTAITTLVEAVGLEKAAEFVGRSPETIWRVYKRLRKSTLVQTAKALGAVRGQKRRRAAAHSVG